MVNKFRFPWYGYPGLFILILAEAGLFLELWFFQIFMTPVCWTGLILFLDAVNFRLAGNSLIISRRREFWWMLVWSIALWYFFEFYNLFIHNWHYVGLPETKWIRYFGYFWSFATIWPGVYEIYELVKNLKIFSSVQIKPAKISGRILGLSFVIGLLFMISPFLVNQKVAAYLAAPVWIGMVLLLDPLNYSWKQESLWRDWQQGSASRLLQLFLTGIVAGFLWEFWNFWATAKWIYTVPILGDIKIFEMPVIGYFGFPAFAVEVFVMWETVRFVMRFK